MGLYVTTSRRRISAEFRSELAAWPERASQKTRDPRHSAEVSRLGPERCKSGTRPCSWRGGLGGLVRSTNWSTALSPQPTIRCTSVQRCVVLLAGTFSLLPSATGGLSRLLIPRSQVRSLPGPCRYAQLERGFPLVPQVRVARQAARSSGGAMPAPPVARRCGSRRRATAADPGRLRFRIGSRRDPSRP
jgi:hypothetical protein